MYKRVLLKLQLTNFAAALAQSTHWMGTKALGCPWLGDSALLGATRVSLHPSFAATAVQLSWGISHQTTIFPSPVCTLREIPLTFSLAFLLFFICIKMKQNKASPSHPKQTPFLPFFHCRRKTKINKETTAFPPPSSNPRGQCGGRMPFLISLTVLLIYRVILS